MIILVSGLGVCHCLGLALGLRERLEEQFDDVEGDREVGVRVDVPHPEHGPVVLELPNLNTNSYQETLSRSSPHPVLVGHQYRVVDRGDEEVEQDDEGEDEEDAEYRHSQNPGRPLLYSMTSEVPDTARIQEVPEHDGGGACQVLELGQTINS